MGNRGGLGRVMNGMGSTEQGWEMELACLLAIIEYDLFNNNTQLFVYITSLQICLLFVLRCGLFASFIALEGWGGMMALAIFALCSIGLRDGE